MRRYFEFQVAGSGGQTLVNGEPVPGDDKGLAAAINFIESSGYEVGHVITLTAKNAFLVMARQVRRPLTEDERVAGVAEMNHLIHTLDQRTGPRPGPIDRLYELLDQERNGKPIEP